MSIASYGWTIVKDHLDAECQGVTGPSHTPFSAEEIQKRGKFFIMYDDDGRRYVDGYFLGDECQEFAPLDQFGTPGLGCTSIHYRNPKTGRMEPL
jgi:hypothetical protein